MTLYVSPEILISGILLYFVSTIVYNRYFHPLAKYPGPFLASFSSLWLVKQVLWGRRLETVEYEWHKKHGSIIRFAPNELAISDPVALREIYSVRDVFLKTDFFRLQRPAFARIPDHLTMIDPKSHTQRKEIVNHLYSTSFIAKSEKYIESVIELFFSRMDEFVESGETFNLMSWLQMFAYDAVGELFLGRKLGYLENRGDFNGFIETLETAVPALQASGHLPIYLRPIALLIASVNSHMRDAQKGVTKMGDDCEQFVKERYQAMKEGKSVREDFLTKVLQIYLDKGEEIDLQLVDIQVEIFIPIFAGSDTTGIALCAIIYYLLKHPHAYKKVVDEIDEATNNGLLPGKFIQYTDALKLPYFHAVCQEGMRIHPPASARLPRVVPKGGRVIAGEFIPEGTKVGTNPYTIHRNKKIFGEDADKFRPERWLVDDTKEMYSHIQTFGIGSRTCIGKNVSLFEVYKLLAQLLRTYKFELADPDVEWKLWNYGFYKPQGLDIRITKRDVVAS